MSKSKTKKHANLHLFTNCELDKCATEGSDKRIGNHGFTLHYEKYFNHLKNKPIRLLEIGVTLNGPSLKMWENYFPNAEIFGIDAVKGCQEKLTRPRVTVFEGNIDELSFANHVIATTGGNFDIIIDDCAHTMTQQKYLFEKFFPILKSDGIYVVEDLHTSYWEPGSQGGYRKSGTMIEYLKDLVDCNQHEFHTKTPTGVEFDAPNYNPDMREGPPTYWDQNIYSIHFYKSICFVFKGNNYPEDN